jgi:hypothetical protein
MFSLATLALEVASAASSYSVKLYDSMWVGAIQLKPGDYIVEMQGDKALFRSGRKVIEVPATFGTSEQKYKVTSMKSLDSHLREIDFGGTKAKIVFAAEAPSPSAGQ